ncbi:MAG: leucine-rich repeat domain-containing protein, partial [Treponemataceae bacterium]|nr:leucine-rich repeat domain-containing protein [Treponemataceae bacterium]
TITCTKCEYANTEEHKYDNGTDNGNGTHTETCPTCAATKTEDHGYAYTRTDAVYHSGVCVGCNARVEGERHVYSGDACGNCASPKPMLDGGTIDDNGKLTKYDGSATTLEIPEGVTGIGSSVFKGCTSLTAVTIPSSVTSIGTSAFYGCTSLTGVIILDGVKSIAIRVFYECTNLTSVTIPASVTSIGSSAFFRCNELKTVNYGGTEEQWGAINKVSGYGLAGKTIKCADGDLTAE